MVTPSFIFYRFVILAIAYLDHVNNVKIGLQTPFTCHLYLHYTDHAILKHPRSRVLRGVSVPWGVYFCFTGFKTVEQEEVGDSLIHTFTVPDWPICEIRNMITTGTVGGVESPSCGPIFSHHNSGPDAPLIESQTTGILWSSISDGVAWGQKLDINNRELFNLAFYLKRVGAPAGEVQYFIRRASDDSVIWWKKLMNSIDIAIAPQWYGLTINPPVLIDEEVRISASATANGPGNLINVYASLTDVKPDEHLFFRSAGGVYTEKPDQDSMYSYNYRPGWDFG